MGIVYTLHAKVFIQHIAVQTIIDSSWYWFKNINTMFRQNIIDEIKIIRNNFSSK